MIVAHSSLPYYESIGELLGNRVSEVIVGKATKAIEPLDYNFTKYGGVQAINGVDNCYIISPFEVEVQESILGKYEVGQTVLLDFDGGTVGNKTYKFREKHILKLVMNI